jgi:hypothetical protein
MFLDLQDPDSIIQWWKVFPARHDGVLEQTLRLSPQFSPAIKEAQRRIAGSEELQALLARSMGQCRQQEAYQAERTARMSSVEMLRRELVASA